MTRSYWYWSRFSRIIGSAGVLFFMLAASGAQPAGAATEPAGAAALVGQFNTLWGDPPPGSGISDQTLFNLTLGTGQRYELAVSETLLEAAGGIVALNNQQVSVEVSQPSSPDGVSTAASPSPGGALFVTSIQTVASPAGADGASAAGDAPAASPAASPVIGTQRWAVVLCQFAGNTTEPVDTTYIDGLYGNTYPGLDHYWREVSYDRINIAGSGVVHPWTQLPHTRSYYYNGSNSADTSLTLLRQDCIATADSVVDFSPYVGINLFFNDILDSPYCCAWGGAQTFTLDGVTKTWRVTWMPPFGYESMATLAHEMGHGFGLPHANFDKGSGETYPYDNYWDVMSAPWGSVTDPTYGTIAQDTNSYHLSDLLGWIDPAHRFTVPPSGVYTLALERTDVPATGDYRMLQIPVDGSSTHFYVVEFRQNAAGTYDEALPSTGVIIHQVRTARTEPAWLKAEPGTTDSRTEGAVWTPGETFTVSDQFSVRVDSVAGTGAVVTVTRFAAPAAVRTIAPDGLVASVTPEFRWNASLGADRYRLVVKRGASIVFDQTYTAAEAACGVTCSVSAASTPPGPTLAEGIHSFTVRPLNSYASGRASKARAFLVDVTPPLPPKPLKPVDGVTRLSIPTLWVVRIPLAVRYRFALDDDSSCTTPFHTSPALKEWSYKPPSLDPGLIYWCAQARDKAGNWSAWSTNPGSFVFAPPVPAVGAP